MISRFVRWGVELFCFCTTCSRSWGKLKTHHLPAPATCVCDCPANFGASPSRDMIYLAGAFSRDCLRSVLLTQHILRYLFSVLIAKNYLSLTQGRPMLQDTLYFFRSDLIFSLLPGLSLPKKGATSEKTKKNTNHDRATPPPRDRPIVPPTRSPRTTPYRDMRTTPSLIPRTRDLTIGHRPTQSSSSPCPGVTMIG